MVHHAVNGARPAIDRQQTLGVLRGALYALIVVGAVASVPMIGRNSVLPMTALLDAWIIGFIITCLVRGRIMATGMLLFLSGYLLTRIVPALANGSPVEDFAQAYRWIIYLIAFTVAIGRSWGPVKPLIRVMWILLTLALAKAVLTLVLLGPGERPGLLLENNFELALFSGLVAVLYRHIERRRALAVVILGAVTLMSGSRSGAIAFVILALYAITQSRTPKLLTQYVLAVATPALILIPVWIFSSRAANSTQIDRLNFLEIFQNEAREWDLATWLVGTTPITPLSSGSCFRLSYYQSLFSSVGDGSCYAVILHAFGLRVIFDAGIVGLVIAFGVTIYAMHRARVRPLLLLALLLIAATNSLSVSGLNNPYVALPILLALLLANPLVDGPSAAGTVLGRRGRQSRMTSFPGPTAISAGAGLNRDTSWT